MPLRTGESGRCSPRTPARTREVSPSAPASANDPAVSDVPFLVFSGAYDTVSSPQWADSFTDGLSEATIVHLDLGSNATASSAPSTAPGCASLLRGAFVDDPTAMLDLSCVETATGPAFALPD